MRVPMRVRIRILFDAEWIRETKYVPVQYESLLSVSLNKKKSFFVSMREITVGGLRYYLWYFINFILNKE